MSRKKRQLLSTLFGSTVLLGAAGLGFGVPLGLLLMPEPAAAFNYSEGNFEVNLTTTAQYSGAVRVNSPSHQLLVLDTLTNDGDENFQHGMLSNQFEVVPVLSITDGSFGVHMSGEAFIDPSYLQRNTNDSPSTLNYNVPNDRNFPSATRNIDGRNAELLDTFAYDTVNFGAGDAQSATFKVGRQTLLWGQSLFFTGNGIAAGQAPVDINKALTLANPQAQQVFLPVGQAVVTYQPDNTITLQGYYQFEWRESQLPGAGSYFSPADFIVPGGTRIVAGLSPFGQVYLGRGPDARPPSNNGQFGLSVKFQLGAYDIGFYGLRFDDKTPQFYVAPYAGPPHVSAAGVQIGNYNIVYAKDIQIYGTSLSTNVGPVNVAGEISVRRNQDLDSNPATFTPELNENSNPGYAVGNTLNGQVSGIYLSPGIPLVPGGLTVLGEIEANRVFAVTRNKNILVGDRTPAAVGMQGVVSPNYYDVVLPNLSVNPSVGITWYPTGRSEIFSTMQAGTGQLNVGFTATYENVWKGGVNYADYLGSTSTIPPGVPKSTFADRGFLSFFVSRTF